MAGLEQNPAYGTARIFSEVHKSRICRTITLISRGRCVVKPPFDHAFDDNRLSTKEPLFLSRVLAPTSLSSYVGRRGPAAPCAIDAHLFGLGRIKAEPHAALSTRQHREGEFSEFKP